MLNRTTRALYCKEFSMLSPHLIGYALIGLLSISLNLIPGETVSFASSILMITAFMVFYCHIAMKSIVAEKKDKNDLFLMTLPVSARQLYFIKLSFASLVFILMWLVYVGAVVLITVTSQHMPSVLLSLYFLVFSVVIPAFFIILTVGVITGSEGWTIIALVFTNVVSTIIFNVITNSADITGAYSEGTFSEIGFLWPEWAGLIFGVMGAATALAISVAIIKGVSKKDFF